MPPPSERCVLSPSLTEQGGTACALPFSTSETSTAPPVEGGAVVAPSCGIGHGALLITLLLALLPWPIRFQLQANLNDGPSGQ